MIIDQFMVHFQATVMENGTAKAVQGKSMPDSGQVLSWANCILMEMVVQAVA